MNLKKKVRKGGDWDVRKAIGGRKKKKSQKENKHNGGRVK